VAFCDSVLSQTTVLSVLLPQYCECFQHSVHCGLNCRCTNCKNFPEAGAPEGGDAAAAVLAAKEAVEDGPPKEVTVIFESEDRQQRRVSLDHVSFLEGEPSEYAEAESGEHKESNENRMERGDKSSNKTPSSKNGGADRMAIMAAVAMTELLGGKRSPAYTSNSAETETSTPELHQEEAKVEKPPSPTRRVSVESPHSGTSETENSPPKKKIKLSPVKSNVNPADTSSSSFPSKAGQQSPQYQPMKWGPQVHFTQPYPPRYSYGQQPPHHHHHHHPSASPRSGSYPGPPRMHHHAMSPPLAHTTTPTRTPATPHAHMQQGPSSSPPMYSHPQYQQQQQQSMPPLQKQEQITPTSTTNEPQQGARLQLSPTYEDVTRSSGLPKSLSFRKICSKCGKTRGEHGELGFGNKCVYQECGKCGAGVHMHLKAGVPMGILCTLTVEDGATPGSSATYERKIRELASRAELQKELQKRKQEAAQRAVAAGAP